MKSQKNLTLLKLTITVAIPLSASLLQAQVTTPSSAPPLTNQAATTHSTSTTEKALTKAKEAVAAAKEK